MYGISGPLAEVEVSAFKFVKSPKVDEANSVSFLN